jgi:hypothetical protein
MPLVNTRGAASAQALGYAARSTDAAFIEDVFSTYLYTGNGSTQTITTGIDLSTKSGLVWMKSRGGATDHALYDTARGATFDLASNLTSAQTTQSTGLTAFSATGFSLGALAKLNTNAVNYASWTFRKQPKFFDVVTYTGNGAAGARAIPHNLGSTPGCIIIKYYSGTVPGGSDWYVYHRGMTTPATQFMRLSGTAAQATTTIWGSTSPTATDFYVSTTTLNQSGTNYVAYVFAHDAGGFGNSGSDNVITCGSFTTNGSGDSSVTLGYEPQMCIIKPSSAIGNWDMFDVMRGYVANTSGTNQKLSANLTNADIGSNYTFINSTGFSTLGAAASTTYIYIAIRRGPMRTPTSGTSVFTPVAYTGDGNADRQIGTTITPDLSIVKARTNNTVPMWADRLRGTAVIYSSATAAEVNPTTGLSGGGQIVDTGVQAGIKILQGTTNVNNVNQSTITYVDWNFKRAPGFFDTVCYEGNSTSARAVSHNLGASPELVIVKVRNDLANWPVYSSALGNNKTLYANLDNASATSGIWGNTTATASAFYVGVAGDYGINNATGFNYVAYLFGSVAGVSKVGSYTGSGTTKQINCGFTGGARFVLIKRTDSTGDWYVWDTARGIIAANDPYLFLNSTALEVTSTDYIDTYSAGFEISSTAPAAINANGGTFIFLAIA